MRIFDRTRGLERGFAKSHVTKKEKRSSKEFPKKEIIYHQNGNTETVMEIVNFLFRNLCNVGISRKNLYHHEEERETDTMVTKDLHIRVAETCVNQRTKPENGF